MSGKIEMVFHIMFGRISVLQLVRFQDLKVQHSNPGSAEI